MDLAGFIRNIPDFPKPGIQFKDITTLLDNAEAFRESVDRMTDFCRDRNIDRVVAIEARGFIFGAPVAYRIGAGVSLVRKKGKLPSDTLCATYELEYGEDELELHTGSVKPGERVVIIDDLLATGGTVRAAMDLMEKIPAEVDGACFLIELQGLGGREKLGDIRVESLIKYKDCG